MALKNAKSGKESDPHSFSLPILRCPPPGSFLRLSDHPFCRYPRGFTVSNRETAPSASVCPSPSLPDCFLHDGRTCGCAGDRGSHGFRMMDMPCDANERLIPKWDPLPSSTFHFSFREKRRVREGRPLLLLPREEGCLRPSRQGAAGQEGPRNPLSQGERRREQRARGQRWTSYLSQSGREFESQYEIHNHASSSRSVEDVS